MPIRGLRLQATTDLAVLPEVPVLAALQRAIPSAVIRRTLVQTGALGQRCWRVPADLVVALVIALGVWGRASVPAVLAELVDGLRERDPARWVDWHPPAKSTLTEARQRLGVRPLRELFGRVVGPVAQPETPGAFRFGLRLMAIDGTTLSLPDSPANARAFGRPTTRRGTGPWATTQGAFPLLRLVLLVECGTHAICDAVLRPYTAGEGPAAQHLLRAVTAGMLVLWDRGLHSWALLHGTREREAHFLGRVAKNVGLPCEAVLADGTYRATIYRSANDRHQGRAGVPVRVIEYVIEDPGRPNPGERYRLVTSLLDPASAPAAELAELYHERWEHETVNAELKTHQLDRTPAPAIRSRRPREVVQEVYGLLLAHWAVRALMAEAATAHGLDPDQLSFIGAVRVLRRAIPRFQHLGTQPDWSPLCSRRSCGSWPVSAPSPAATATIRASSSGK
jgi:hypothetical protein